MLRHPVLWLGGLLSLGLFGLFTWQSAPVLHRDDTNIAGALLAFAGATLIVANLAASRAARNGTDELYDTTPATRQLRTLGQLLALVFPVLGSMLLGAVMFGYMFLDSPVGTPRIAELAAGPVTVALLGAVGIAIGKWKPHPALGPMAVVIIAGVEVLFIQPIIGLSGTSGDLVDRFPWFALWVPLSLTGEIASELVIRPSGWHLLYLVGLVVVAVTIALARAGRRARLIPVVAAGAAGAVLGSLGQLTPVTASQRAALAAMVEDPEEHQVCEERRGVTYCAYPAYVPWIDRWARPVEGAMRVIPPHARPEGLVVRQRFGTYFEGPIDVPDKTMRRADRELRRAGRSGTGSTIWTQTQWGRGELEGDYEIGLSLWVAMQAVDLPASREEMRLTPDEVALARRAFGARVPERVRHKFERALSRRRAYSCTTLDQARALTALWVAGQATPSTRATVERVAAEYPFGFRTYETDGRPYAFYEGPSFWALYPRVSPPMWNWVTFAENEFHYAAQLLEKPQHEVAEAIAQRWDQMMDPTAKTTGFLGDFGLAMHPTPEELTAGLPEDVRIDRWARPRAQLARHLAEMIPCL
ncbi:MAG: hypothetical protein M3161_00885 [Actinomycetota bacterium]|nr:hypothetical protein [Actinomycetota bacterium]